MATTVQKAFDEFRADFVDLDSGDVDTARRSRNNLIDQLKGLPSKVPGFPRLTNDFVLFGSFARHTKIRPLDDIDLMMELAGGGTVESSSLTAYTYRLRLTKQDAALAIFADPFGYVNSTRILNKIKSSLDTIHHYRKADINKRMQAVTLNLISYDWVFDIVPAVGVADGTGTTVHYLIPNGSGDWIRTDPRIDTKNIAEVNTAHERRFRPVMRLLKYWNRRTYNKPRLGSYHFETLVLNCFKNAPKITTYRGAVKYFFEICRLSLLLPCPDPKGLGPNLDAEVSLDDKQKIATAMSSAHSDAVTALDLERRGYPKDAMICWRRVFGSEFPTYG